MNYSSLNLNFKITNDKILESLLETKPFMYGSIEYRYFGKYKNIFTKTFDEYLDQKNMQIGDVEVWTVPENTDVFWHIDSYPITDFAKILIPWKSSNILLEWGECTSSISTTHIKYGVGGYTYLGFNNDEISVTGSTLIKCPTLINPSIIHRAINQNNQKYHSLNLSILDTNTHCRLTTLEAVSRF